MLASEHPAKEEPVSMEVSIMAQPFIGKVGPIPSFFSIPEEDEVSVKDSVTSGLPAHGFTEGMEAGGSSRHPMMPKFKLAKGEAAIDADTE